MDISTIILGLFLLMLLLSHKLSDYGGSSYEKALAARPMLAYGCVAFAVYGVWQLGWWLFA